MDHVFFTPELAMRSIDTELSNKNVKVGGKKVKTSEFTSMRFQVRSGKLVVFVEPLIEGNDGQWLFTRIEGKVECH